MHKKSPKKLALQLQSAKDKFDLMNEIASINWIDNTFLNRKKTFWCLVKYDLSRQINLIKTTCYFNKDKEGKNRDSQKSTL